MSKSIKDQINQIRDDIDSNEYWLNSGTMSNERKIQQRKRIVKKLKKELVMLLEQVTL